MGGGELERGAEEEGGRENEWRKRADGNMGGLRRGRAKEGLGHT